MLNDQFKVGTAGPNPIVAEIAIWNRVRQPVVLESNRYCNQKIKNEDFLSTVRLFVG
jgi:hypothetical protein